MDGGGITVPVATRTRLQVKRRSFPQESSIRSREDVKSRRPGKQLSGNGSSTSEEEENSETETEPKSRPTTAAVEDSEFVEFLLIDRDGTNVRKFYLDRMALSNPEVDSGGAGCCKVCRHCVCRRSEGKKKKNSTVKQGNSSSVRPRVSSRDSDKKKRLRNRLGKGIVDGRTSGFPILISDDEQDDDDDDGEDVEPKDILPANKHGDGDHGDGDGSKSSQEWMPLKKRHKFEEQELPGADMNSTPVDINLKSHLDMEGAKLFKEMNTCSTPIETTEIQNEIPLATIKKEMMEAAAYKSLP